MDYVNNIGKISGINIGSLFDLLNAIKKRMDFFEENNCNSSDHGIEYIPSNETTLNEAENIFNKILNKLKVNKKEEDMFLSFMMTFLAGEYSKRNWVMQIHLSVIRNQNSRGFQKSGADSGFDSVGNMADSNSINKFFDKVEQEYGMPKTIVYTLNPAAYYIISTAAGNFNSKFPGKVQMGPAWWFCDNRDSITEQIKIFANTGILGLFNGMLTDSRSFLSFVRHDYFRRILCSIIGEWIENGEFPDDDSCIKDIVERICFYNAKNYFEGGDNAS